MKLNQKKLKEILDDSDRLGPSSKLGASNKLTSDEAEKLFKKAELQMVSLRLPNEIIEKLKVLAEEEGTKYQPFIRKILIEVATRKHHTLEDRLAKLEDQVAALTSSKAS